tara:strand:- start:9184 stop:9531 length:348 start_codon:yes stop_codon:yes gene_type:complete
MINRYLALAAIALSVMATTYPQISVAENFTAAKLLKQSEQGQRNFIEISISMAGSIATQADPKIARCLDNWYFKDASRRGQRKSDILRVMRKYPNHHPSGLILAVIQKACGSFKR